MTGWICAKCGASYSPSVTECWKCNNPMTVTSSTWNVNAPSHQVTCSCHLYNNAACSSLGCRGGSGNHADV